MTDLTNQVLDGKYEVIRLLGEGGMGRVYEAKHKLIGRRLAIKFLHPTYVASHEVTTRFQREAQAAAAIGHENIIEVTDMGTAPDGAPYIVMEFLEGSDLGDVIEKHGALPVTRTANIMCQALSALQAAHNARIIHRDLKPENIYLIKKGERADYVKLLDFGISKFKSLETTEAKGLTQTGTVLGTPYYMSPEQARGDQDISPSSDIYTMGVILFQMLTGRLPFDAPNYNALLIKILTEEIPSPAAFNPDLPEDLVETIMTAMARNPRSRFSNCLDFKKRLLPHASPGMATPISTMELRRAVETSSTMAPGTPFEMSRTSMKRPKTRRTLLAGSIAGAVLVAGAAIFFAFFYGKGDDLPHAGVKPIALEAPAKPESVPPKPQPEALKEAALVPLAEKAEPEEVQVEVTASPEQAEIRIDGMAVGTGTFKGAMKKDDKTQHLVEIAAEGYVTESAEFRFDKDAKLFFNLKKEEAKTSRRSSRSRRTSSAESQSSSGAEADQAETTSKSRKKAKRQIDDDDPWQ